MKASEEEVDLLQTSLVEQRWELQDSIADISSRMTDLHSRSDHYSRLTASGRYRPTSHQPLLFEQQLLFSQF